MRTITRSFQLDKSAEFTYDISAALGLAWLERAEERQTSQEAKSWAEAHKDFAALQML